MELNLEDVEGMAAALTGGEGPVLARLFGQLKADGVVGVQFTPGATRFLMALADDRQLVEG